MADEQPRSEGLEPDPLVEALLPDPSAGPPNVIVLQGRLGRSTTEGVWRLYTSETLDVYVELPESEIRYTRRLPGDAGVIVWVSASDEVRVVNTTRRVQADFLGGAITAAGLPSGGAPADAFGRLAPPPTSRLSCPTDVRCPSDDVPCGTVGGQCVPTSRLVGCPPTLPLTGCPPTSRDAGCPPPPPPPTTPAAGCPRPSEFAQCQSSRALCSTVRVCPTSPAGCPSNVLRCVTNEGNCVSIEVLCRTDGPACGELGF